MDRREAMMQLHAKGYNCGQIITALVAEAGGWDESACEGLAGMCESCGEICGSLRGGDYCINKYYRLSAAKEHGISEAEVYDVLSYEEQKEMMLGAKAASAEMYRRFKDINGDLFCSNLRGENMMVTCAKYVNDVAEILISMFTA